MKFLFQPWDTPGVSYLNFTRSKPKLAVVTPWIKDEHIPIKPLPKLFDVNHKDAENKAKALWGDYFDPKCEGYDFSFVDIKLTEVTEEYADSGDYMVTDGIHFLFFTLLKV